MSPRAWAWCGKTPDILRLWESYWGAYVPFFVALRGFWWVARALLATIGRGKNCKLELVVHVMGVVEHDAMQLLGSYQR